jgi:hypothetical protein
MGKNEAKLRTLGMKLTAPPAPSSERKSKQAETHAQKFRPIRLLGCWLLMPTRIAHTFMELAPTLIDSVGIPPESRENHPNPPWPIISGDRQ